jgi:hypothetical protein
VAIAMKPGMLRCAPHIGRTDCTIAVHKARIRAKWPSSTIMGVSLFLFVQQATVGQGADPNPPPGGPARRHDPIQPGGPATAGCGRQVT